MKQVIELKGKYGKANIYAKTVENELIAQCINLLNEPMTKDTNIAIMPDTHAGKGCMIGTTMEVKDEICPNLVGVDIGCGMLTVNLGKEELDLDKLDKIIDEFVPLGFNRHEEISKESETFFANNEFKARVDKEVPLLSLGTLGGGNHFIEIDVDEQTQEKYLVIHTGSRNLGVQVANYWQDVAIEKMVKPNQIDIPKMIERLKEKGKYREIEKEIIKAKEENQKIRESISNNQKELASLKGEDLENYLYDMKITVKYAKLNREMIAETILRNYYGKGLSDFENFETIHNYIDVDERMLRKGAISAKKDKKVLIPLNMRDGSLIAIGKGNKEWNNSAPHGAGRLMSRAKAKENITLDDFKKSMEGIYSTSINEATIDESPFAYKDAKEIIDLVQDTVDIVKHIKPIYNKKG